MLPLKSQAMLGLGLPLEGHAAAINLSSMSETASTPFFAGLDAIRDQLASGRLPPVERWNPPYCGDIDIKITRDGVWHYGGSAIRRPQLVRLFSTILRRDEDDKYYLVTPAEKILVHVECAPFIATMVERSGTDLVFTTNVGDRVIAGAGHPIRVEEEGARRDPLPFIHVRGRLEALISRPVFYELAAMGETRAQDGRRVHGVTSGGTFFALGDVDGAA